MNSTVDGGRGAGRRSSSSDVRVRGRGSWNHDDIVSGLLRTDLDILFDGHKWVGAKCCRENVGSSGAWACGRS